MKFFQLASSIGFTLTLALTGCDKSPTASTATPPPATPANPAASPAAAAASAAAMTELAGTYNAVSDIPETPGFKRHQKLVLDAAGTSELDTTVTPADKPTATPKSSDVAAGTYTATASEVTVLFTSKDGKTIPAGQPREMKLKRDKGDKALTGDDGRTFERAK